MARLDGESAEFQRISQSQNHELDSILQLKSNENEVSI
jgi:hypothetical protein